MKLWATLVVICLLTAAGAPYQISGAAAAELTEREAETLIEAVVAAGPIETRTSPIVVQLVETDMWTNGTVARLTEQNKCWPAEASFYQNIPGSYSSSYLLGDSLARRGFQKYVMSGRCIGADLCIMVSPEGIAEQCRSFLLAAMLIQPTNSDRMYAEAIEVPSMVVTGVDIKNILSRGGTAWVTYTLSWEDSEWYRMIGHTAKTQFKFLSGGPLELDPLTAVLQEFDQEWRVMCAPPASHC